MSDDALEAAQDILALVDEYPTGPLSFERRDIEEKIKYIFLKYTQKVEDQTQVDYDLGYEMGFSEGYAEARQEFENQIDELKEEVNDLNEALDKAEKDYEQGVNDGFTARGF